MEGVGVDMEVVVGTLDLGVWDMALAAAAAAVVVVVVVVVDSRHLVLVSRVAVAVDNVGILHQEHHEQREHQEGGGVVERPSMDAVVEDMALA